jgi:hypothetical protein
LKGILPTSESFQGGERFILFKLAYSAELKKYMYPSKENPRCLKQEHLHIVSLWELSGVFERNTSCNLGVSCWG